jgi:hypothetical protein
VIKNEFLEFPNLTKIKKADFNRRLFGLSLTKEKAVIVRNAHGLLFNGSFFCVNISPPERYW